MSAEPNFDDLINEYRASIPEKMSNLDTLCKALTEAPSKETLEPFKKAIHKIAGTAGTYGYAEVSTLCKSMELELQGEIDSELKLDVAERCSKFLEKLKEMFK